MYFPSMNIEQAKSIPLEELLLRLGYTPSRRSRDQLWYLSPLRTEFTPSFKINTAMNAWYDFGAAEGGDIIDLVKKLEGLATFPPLSLALKNWLAPLRFLSAYPKQA